MFIFDLLLGILIFPGGLGFVPKEDFFPFGDQNGDSQLPIADDNFVNVTLTRGSAFRFFNSSYSSLFVNNNGAISFLLGVSQYTPTCRSLLVPMIVPFWADVDTRFGGLVHYRESTNRLLLLKAAGEIHKGFPGIPSIDLGWIFIVTWDHVAFYGANPNCNGTALRNTFQTILTTDGFQSFAIFFYNNITWTTGTASQGDACKGVGGTPAKGGFDLGDGHTFFDIPGTCTPAIINITQTSNVKEPGKWMFRIDNEFVSSGCKNVPVAGERLSISPSFITIFGHVPITLRGPCLQNATTVKCRFHDLQQKFSCNGSFDARILNVSAVVSKDNTSATCMVPFLNKNGRIQVDLVVGSGENSTREEIFPGHIYTTEPSDDLLTFDLIGNSSISMSWAKINFNVTNSTQKLDLELVEFVGNNWTSRGIIKENLTNTGIFQGELNGHGISLLKNLTNNVYIVKLTGSLFEKPTSIFSGIKYAAGGDNGTGRVFSQLCDNWYKADNGPPKDALPCPPLLQQARVDERFQPDTTSGAMLQFYHPGAEFSFRQRVPSVSGSGQQCVYRNGRILMGPPGGGTADASSPNGIFGFMSHVIRDVIPWFWCCKFSNNSDSCRKYYVKRPSDSGANYSPPRPSRATGDPHITTFDLVSYTFNGVGEFWMIIDKSQNNSFLMQARMEQFRNANNNGTFLSDASVFTAFVMQQSNFSQSKCNTEVKSVHLQISVALTGIQVLLDKELIPVGVDKTVMHSGVSITIHSDRRVSVSFSSGYSFEFTAISNNSALNMISSASFNLLGNKSKGLLGIFDGNKENDLTGPDGSITNISATIETIHYNFGVKWRAAAADSLFVYPPGKNHATYQNFTFVPRFEPVAALPPDVVTLCGQSKECLFDFSTTGSRDFANITLQAENTFNKTIRIVSEKVGMCNEPVSPANGYFESANFLVEADVTFYCNEGYRLVGNNVLSCQLNSNGAYLWNGTSPACEQPESEKKQDVNSCDGNKSFLAQLLCQLFVGIMSLFKVQ